MVDSNPRVHVGSTHSEDHWSGEITPSWCGCTLVVLSLTIFHLLSDAPGLINASTYLYLSTPLPTFHARDPMSWKMSVDGETRTG